MGETMTDTKTKQCPDCDGSGSCEYERNVIDYINGGFIDAYWDTCDTCHGTGEVEDDREEDEIDF